MVASPPGAALSAAAEASPRLGRGRGEPARLRGTPGTRAPGEASLLEQAAESIPGRIKINLAAHLGVRKR
ncbi:hypothetical protein AV530_018787 [Patagioenas fasciata monilis]|uniref:Uncharacterized protein n=1 Tax=Patagioenas fasciata monilis TaxID=372326 RepID=A0A1V4JJX6_PATFA|nr:hypothetical protein AV530_018787 [Patagioenas fasciata monilis]